MLLWSEGRLDACGSLRRKVSRYFQISKTWEVPYTKVGSCCFSSQRQHFHQISHLTIFLGMADVQDIAHKGYFRRIHKSGLACLPHHILQGAQFPKTEIQAFKNFCAPASVHPETLDFLLREFGDQVSTEAKVSSGAASRTKFSFPF